MSIKTYQDHAKTVKHYSKCPKTIKNHQTPPTHNQTMIKHNQRLIKHNRRMIKNIQKPCRTYRSFSAPIESCTEPQLFPAHQCSLTCAKMTSKSLMSCTWDLRNWYQKDGPAKSSPCWDGWWIDGWNRLKSIDIFGISTWIFTTYQLTKRMVEIMLKSQKIMGGLPPFSTGAGFRNHPPYDGLV